MTRIEMKKRFEEYFDAHFDEILSDLNELISIESAAAAPLEYRPYGQGSADALAWAFKFMEEKVKMHTVNYGNYVVKGECDINTPPVLAVLAHLDTVPAGEGWSYPPYRLTADGENLYGRGTIDDKGPAIAAMWAAKAIRDLEIPVKNFALVFGGGEEVGDEKDIEEYAKNNGGFPPMVFTPDGSFPVLNCEKGMIHLTFSAPFADGFIKSINGGTVINAIPDKCSVTYSEKDAPTAVMYSGKSAHGSRPENGDNAVTKFLAEYAENRGDNPMLCSLAKLFPHGEFDGSSCGMGFSDEVSGRMSCALTMLNTNGSRLCGGVDIRFPIDRTYGEIRGIITEKLAEAGFEIDECSGMEPHYVSADTPLVKTLLEVYEDIKGEKGECIAEGGVTYVHNIPGGVAFGAEFPWENNNMHGADEHISVETFKYNLNMYANAIVRLCE